MKYFILFVILFFSLMPRISKAQITHDQLMDISFALSDQLGKTYQMQKNCGFNSNQTPDRMAGLFINYMDEKEVQSVMNVYFKGAEKMAAWSCDKKQVMRTLDALQTSLSNYIKMAQQFMKPY